MAQYEKMTPAQNEARPMPNDALQIGGQSFVVEGGWLKTASLKDVWREDLIDPEAKIRALKAAPEKIDILRFWQRIPDTEPKFGYHREMRDLAVLPVSTYEYWWNKQNNRNARRMVKWAKEQGVVVQEVPLTDELVRGIIEIFNQSPIRRGKPMRHYGKNFETVKKEMAEDLEFSVFVAAHYKDELIGFIKFMQWDRYATITLILDKQAHRDKAPMNAMLGKVIGMCAERKIPYLTYAFWRSDAYRQFQQSNGFERMVVPEYFVPLTLKGRIALALRLHEGIKGILPEKMFLRLRSWRARWYKWRYGVSSEHN